MYPFRTREPPSTVAKAEESPASEPKADARTRTGDPFITRERQVGDARPRKGTRGDVLARNQAVSRPSEWTRVPARARADVPVLYPHDSGYGSAEAGRADRQHHSGLRLPEPVCRALFRLAAWSTRRPLSRRGRAQRSRRRGIERCSWRS